MLLAEKNDGCSSGEGVGREGKSAIGGLDSSDDVETGGKKTARRDNDGLEGAGGKGESDEEGVCGFEVSW